jgi:hypothetical protein
VTVVVNRLVPPDALTEPALLAQVLPKLANLQISNTSSQPQLWAAFSFGSSLSEHVFGKDVSEDRAFSAQLGSVVYSLCTRPEAAHDEEAAHSMNGLLDRAAKEPSSLFAFLHAAATGDSEPLPLDAERGSAASTSTEKAKERRRLGTYVALHILLNVAHREHSEPVQRFMARVLDVSGCTQKTRTILTKMCLALHRAGDWDGIARA